VEVIIRETKAQAAQLAAALLADAIKAKPDIVLGLATGRTMEDLYALLAAKHRDEGLDFSRVTTFNLDEYIGLPADSPYSYRAYMNQHLFDKVNIAPANTHLPDGTAEDLDAASAHYEELIAKAGGIDLQLLGIGRSGHIGFNEPLSAMYSRTRPKALTPTTVAQNAPLFPSPDMMPRRALTMGVGTILDARRCLMLVVGEEKAQVLGKAVEGPVTSMISATALQLHPKCTVICDEDAAATLTHRDYYRWIFENEPEWQPYH
jgi:glucosamine-6-phosphate deaminase